MSNALAAPLHLVPSNTRAAILRSVRLGLESLRARPPMSLSEWAAKHFIMAGDSSHQRGAWEAWPFQIGIMDSMSNDDIYETDVIKAKRVGYTKILSASIGFDASWRRRNQALWQPTDDDRDSFVKSEVDPMIDGVPAVREARRLTKGVEDTIKYKQFRDSVLHLLGGKAARAYRRITIAAAKMDELDGFDRQIEKSADPATLAEGRLEGAAFPCFILGSTPRLKGLSHIEHRANMAQAYMRYQVTCIHCKVEHPLEFGDAKQRWGFKWHSGDPETVKHVCPHCLEGITQADYLANWVGVWVCDRTGIRYGADCVWRNAEGAQVKPPRHVAWHVWTAYSPQREWVDIVRQFLAARAKQKVGDDGPMQGFVNEVLGKTWEVELERTHSSALLARAEDYPLRVAPYGAVKVVTGVDVQGYGWECITWAVGRGEEMWAIDRTVIDGNPADQREWDEKLEPYLLQSFLHANGTPMPINAAAIDSGGHYTHQCYVFVRGRAKQRNVFAIKGESVPGKPIKGRSSLQDVNERGKVVRKGVRLWWVGTDTAKDLLHGRFQVMQHGPGYVHLSKHLAPECFEQLTNESRVLMRTHKGEESRWVKTPGKRVEMLDGTIYAMFCVQALDLHKLTDRQWQILEQGFESDLFAAPLQAALVDGQVVVYEAPEVVESSESPLPVAPAPVAQIVQKPKAQSSLAKDDWSRRL